MVGTVERLEKRSEGGLVTWAFVVRADEGPATIVELRGSQIHGALRDGDRVRFVGHPQGHRDSSWIACPSAVANETLGVTVTVEAEGRAQRLGISVGRTALTAGISTIASAVATLALGALFSSNKAIRATPGRSEPEPTLSTSALIALGVVLFVIAWLGWFGLAGRRRGLRINVVVTLTIAVGVAVGVTLAGLAVNG